MSDEELIAELRKLAWSFGGDAADRIEALVKDRERLGRELNTARYGQPDFAWSIHKQAMADLQARAERLTEALTLAANRLHRRAVDFDTGSRAFIETSEWAEEARAALTQEEPTDGE